jgi:murein DD-endopeptidase MepM/ murein hydrolase activator NlpD
VSVPLARPLRRWMLLVAAVTVVAVPRPAGAQPAGDQEQADREVAEASAILEQATDRAQEAAARYAAADAALPDARARLDVARGEVVAARVRARSAEREADRAKEELDIADARFDDSVVAVEQARDEVAMFAAAAYKGSRLSGVNLMLHARGPAEAVERLGYLDHVAGVEQAAIDGLTSARLAARDAQNEAAVASDEADAARLATADALARAETAEVAAEEAADEAAALVDARADALAIAEAERDESLVRYEEAEAEAARVADELRAWEASQQAPPPASSSSNAVSGFLMPTGGWQSSPFGMRFDPFFGVWQLHSGVDIAAPGGTPIHAVADGTVIRAGWNGGYGNFTCLSHGTYHGQGLSTCYAHQSEILVWEGQSVRRGEAIGRVGTTGASTGDHLHFEVRLDGNPTDPVPFLPSF